MSSNYQTLLLTLLVFILTSIFCNVSPAYGNKSHVDSWVPIKNLTDKKVLKIGKFAVGEQNYKANSKLVFCKLVKAEMLQGRSFPEVEIGFTSLIVDGEQRLGFNEKGDLGFWVMETPRVERFNIFLQTHVLMRLFTGDGERIFRRLNPQRLFPFLSL
ncbi:hypothetical protein E3N88_01990 [Mikania micrantha]|uniref:Uncharacterized protein n=1 Tax=Mikania micrantha TaxID=192012 RepID=A0A5N6Q2J1_9ASTR|nr:hypothetical protein E3N88_01990 [Mikania micrantha]